MNCKCKAIAPWVSRDGAGAAHAKCKRLGLRCQAHRGVMYISAHIHNHGPLQAGIHMRDLMMNAAQGDAAAAYQLGYLYETGDGVAVDEKEALRWYLMGANKGNAKAQFNLAVMLEEGRGQACDLRKALHWYEKSAQQGEWNAQYNLALFYTLGKGCEADLPRAHMWFSLAAREGNSDAIHNRDAVSKQLNPEQMALSQQWTAQWLQNHSNRNGA